MHSSALCLRTRMTVRTYRISYYHNLLTVVKHEEKNGSVRYWHLVMAAMHTDSWTRYHDSSRVIGKFAQCKWWFFAYSLCPHRVISYNVKRKSESEKFFKFKSAFHDWPKIFVFEMQFASVFSVSFREFHISHHCTSFYCIWFRSDKWPKVVPYATMA